MALCKTHAAAARLATRTLAVAASDLAVLKILAVLEILTVATGEMIGHYTYYEGLKSGGLFNKDVFA